MSFKDVIDRFALVSGLELEEISKWVFIIVDCIKYFESFIGSKKLSVDEKKRLSHACAVYAYYKYSLYNIADTSTKFKAGDIEISKSESISDKAHTMWQQEKQEISTIVDFDDFHFMRVGV